MTTAVIHSDKNGIVGFEISGHCGYLGDGYDIVCSAISAMSQMVIVGLEEIVSIDAKVEIGDGELFCRISDMSRCDKLEKARVLFETLRLGIINISDQYPEYVRILEKEV